MPTEEELLNKWMPNSYQMSDQYKGMGELSLSKEIQVYYFAKQGKIITLGLQKLPNLVELPSFFNILTSLIYLSIKNCGLQSLKNFPTTLDHITSLIIEDCSIKSLQNLPPSLPKLGYLYLSGNPLTTLYGLPDDLPMVTKLVLEVNQLTTLDGLPNILPQLKSLDINGNQLQSLPINRTRCPQLTEISALDNNFATLHGCDRWVVSQEINFFEHWKNFPQVVIDTLDLHDPFPFPYDVDIDDIDPDLISDHWRGPKKIYVGCTPAVMDEVIEQYRPTIAELVISYCEGKKITPIQEQRIIREGTYEDWFLFQSHCPQDRRILPHLEIEVHFSKKQNIL